MTDFVADSSVVLSWLLAEDHSPEVERLFDSLSQGAVPHAPSLLRFEVANVLLIAFSRKRRIARKDFLAGLEDFDDLPIRYDGDSARLTTTQTARLAEKHGLTVYDASYLELATRLHLPLATLDAALKSAGAREGVAVL